MHVGAQVIVNLNDDPNDAPALTHARQDSDCQEVEAPKKEVDPEVYVIDSSTESSPVKTAEQPIEDDTTTTLAVPTTTLGVENDTPGVVMPAQPMQVDNPGINNSRTSQPWLVLAGHARKRHNPFQL